MKRIIYLLLAVTTVTACKKDNTLSDAGTSDIPAVPSSFGQNALVEQFTSSLNGQCPPGNYFIDSVESLHPGRVIGVNIHVNDSVKATPTAAPLQLNDLFNPAGTLPAGMVNRMVTDPATDLSVITYPSHVTAALGNSPRCGLALDANDIVNGWLNLYVHIGLSSDLPGEYRLHVYLVEDLFSSADSIYDQFNDFSQTGPTPIPGNPFFSLPYRINNYGHIRVLRRILNNGGYQGESLSGFDMSAGNEIVSNYRVDLTGLNSGSHSIVAFVDKYGPDGTTHRIENVQFVKVGQVAVWN